MMTLVGHIIKTSWDVPYQSNPAHMPRRMCLVSHDRSSMVRTCWRTVDLCERGAIDVCCWSGESELFVWSGMAGWLWMLLQLDWV
eukprot:1363222-Amorphochlora_amoeboformis.AAC.1